MLHYALTMHHVDADPYSTYHFDVDPDSDPDFYLMLMQIQIQLFTLRQILLFVQIRIRSTW